MIEDDHDPSTAELFAFACAMPLLLAVIGAQRWHAGSNGTAKALWIVAAVAAVVLLAWPSARRALYVRWRVVTRPVARLASFVALAVIFVVVATPTALLLRALGRDPMQRGFDREAASYWTPRSATRARRSYFRQF